MGVSEDVKNSSRYWGTGITSFVRRDEAS